MYRYNLYSSLFIDRWPILGKGCGESGVPHLRMMGNDCNLLLEKVCRVFSEALVRAPSSGCFATVAFNNPNVTSVTSEKILQSDIGSSIVFCAGDIA